MIAVVLLFPQLALAGPGARSEKETADAWADLGNWKKAVVHYQKAIELDPGLREARLRLANGLYRLGDRKGALAQLGRLYKDDPRSAAVAAATAGIWLESKEPAKACDWFARALAVEAGHERALFGSGQCHQALFEATRHDPDKRAALEGYQAYLQRYPQGSFAAQAAEAVEALRLGDAGAKLAGAREVLAAGKYRLAVDELRALVHERPDIQEAQYLLGMALASPVIDDLDGALAAWEKAPAVKQARLQLGIAAYEDDEPVDAIEHLEKAVEIDPDYAEAWYQLGLVYSQLIDAQDRAGYLAKAQKAYQRVASLAPRSRLAQRAESKLQLLTGQVHFLSESEVIDTASEVQLGRKITAQIEQRFGVLDDEKLQARLDSILRRVAAKSERLTGVLPYHVKVLNVDGINALSFTGGTIYLYKGLLDFVRVELGDSDDALAAVIAHEVVHVDRRHGLGMLDLVGGARQLMEGRSLNVQSLDTLMKGISRRHEYEADQLGALYAYRAGFNPAVAYRFHRRMIATGHEVPDDLDHPTHRDRAGRLKEYLLGLRAKSRHFDQGLRCLDQGKLEQAVRHLEVFLGVFPTNLAARNNLGVALHRLAMQKRVGEHGYKLSTEVDPRSRIRKVRVREAGPGGAFSPDVALMREAAAHFRAVLDRQPDYLPARTNLGACLLALGKTSEAIAAFQRVLTARADSPEARNNLAVARLVAGQAAGRAELEALIHARPQYKDAYFNLARACQQAGDRAAARKMYLAYLTHDKESGWAAQARASLAALTDPPPAE